MNFRLKKAAKSVGKCQRFAEATCLHSMFCLQSAVSVTGHPAIPCLSAEMSQDHPSSAIYILFLTLCVYYPPHIRTTAPERSKYRKVFGNCGRTGRYTSARHSTSSEVKFRKPKEAQLEFLAEKWIFLRGKTTNINLFGENGKLTGSNLTPKKKKKVGGNQK